MTSHRIWEYTSKEDAQQIESSNVIFVTKNLLPNSFYRNICTQAIVPLWKKIMNVLSVNHQNGLNQQNLWKNRKQHHTGEIPLLKCPYEIVTKLVSMQVH